MIPPTLYIFPHAGGSAKFYVPFAKAFSTRLKRIAVQYPGRTDNHRVTPITSIAGLADDIYAMMSSADDPPGRVAFFGHSMGALVAFDVALKFESSGKPIAALFVSACAAPGRVGYEYLQVPDAELLNVVSQVTGMNPAFINDESFAATILPTLRSYRAIAGYDSPGSATLSCPIYAYLGDNDGIVAYDNLAAWSGRTTSEFCLRIFPGDHFYLNQNLPELTRDIETRMSDCCEPFS